MQRIKTKRTVWTDIVQKGKETQILPVIINVHGGGLLLGNKEFNKYFCALLSNEGISGVQHGVPAHPGLYIF